MSNQDSQDELSNQLLELSIAGSDGVSVYNRERLAEFINAHTQKAVDAYHNEITDNEKKVWLYREDYERRLTEARIDELNELVLSDAYPLDDTTEELSRHIIRRKAVLREAIKRKEEV